MLRNVYLEGEMGEKFGTGFQIYAESVGDVLRCLDANVGNEIRQYLVDCHNKDIGFVVDVADNSFDDERELLMPMHEGDITITPMPAGSKSAFAKILMAIALVVATSLLGSCSVHPVIPSSHTSLDRLRRFELTAW